MRAFKPTAHFERSLPRIGLIVFDVDGVLIDTSSSFPVAIVNAVNRYGKVLDIDGWAISALSMVDHFKKIPGFNNDWDVAQGLMLYQLQQHTETEPPPFPEFLKALERAGGGIHALQWFVEERISSEDFHTYYRPEICRHLAMEYYGGERYTESLYGIRPQYGVHSGAIEAEQVLIDMELVCQLTLVKGIYTGRNQSELGVALTQMDWKDIPRYLICVDNGDTPTKPNPEPLLAMLQYLDKPGVIFVGDAYDDAETIRRFNAAYPSRPGVFVGVDPDGSRLENISDNRVGNVNTLLKYLIQYQHKQTENIHA